MKTKKVLIGMMMLGVFLGMQKVSAQEIYYENDLGVTLSEQEFHFIGNIFWDGYQEYLSVEDYNQIKNLNIFDKEIEKKTITNEKNTRGTSVTSNLRTLTIAKSCASTCFVTLTMRWNGTPFVKSFDVVGIRSEGVNLSAIGSAEVVGNNYFKTYNNPKTFNNGFGFSITVPSADNLRTTLKFTATKGGSVYGSYQHAVKNTTESISRQYSSLGNMGYGKVFNFYGEALSVYDNAPGVDIYL